jgi:MoxR-like ATPase
VVFKSEVNILINRTKRLGEKMSQDLIEKVHRVVEGAKKIVYGQDQLLEGIITALVCEGHLLIEGMPGLGKTLSVSTMSRLCDLTFQRIQFTPDLLPSDLIGTMIFSQKTETFSTKFGPIFTQILLADEINRSPAKVQSALLEAMAERQVTIGEETYKLKKPFVVLATQNPIEQEGTYNLPEAQLDRFMMKVIVDYPDKESEKKILDLKEGDIDSLQRVLGQEELIQLKSHLNTIYTDDKMKDFIIKVIHATRPQTSDFVNIYDGAILAGASPRAAIWLFKVSKFKAMLAGRDYVIPEDIIDIIPSIIGHRIILSYEAIIDKMDPRKIAVDIANRVY